LERNWMDWKQKLISKELTVSYDYFSDLGLMKKMGESEV
jgi:hypothetical protein